MEEEKSYHIFLQSLYSEEIYLVKEPEVEKYKQENLAPSPIANEPVEEKATSPEKTKEVSDELIIPEKETDKVVFVLNKSLDKEVGIRFNTLLEKLGFTEQNTNIFYLTQYSDDPKLESAIFKLKPNKFVFLGAKDAIKSQQIEENFSTINIANKQVLLLPDFSLLIKEKEMVMKCWQALQKFLEVA